MDKLIIEGGRPLEGTIRTAGSKNAVLPILAASLLTRGTLKITGAPRLADVSTMLDILRDLGAEAEQDEDGTIEISAAGDISGTAPWER
ncbi:MAG: UDP-N-acetylglucosamine 1-carboxyvinyltransferase, partial [Planctomycetota bacterium]